MRKHLSSLRSALCLAAALPLATPLAEAKEQQPPNILVFLVDDLGYMDVGANNPNCFYDTPNIDALNPLAQFSFFLCSVSFLFFLQKAALLYPTSASNKKINLQYFKML